MDGYLRVIPRDLFNEGDFLKCLGALALVVEGDRRMALRHDGGPFDIQQDHADGSIWCANVLFWMHGRRIYLHRPLNSRSPWPLYARADDDDIRVFEVDGQLSADFVNLLKGTPA